MRDASSDIRPLAKTLLFCPATSSRKAAKAIAGAADAVIIDLEDSVAADQKAGARAAAMEIAADASGKPIYVRVNALDTVHCFEDLAAAGAAPIRGIMLPKVEVARDLHIADWMLRETERRCGKQPGSTEIFPIIETAAGIAAAGEIAHASSRVQRLVLGAADLGLDMDLDTADETGVLNHARFALALASRAAGLEGPLDTAFLSIDNAEAFRISTLAGKRLGFSGRCCIHPAQVAIVNSIFAPSAEEIDRARLIVSAFNQAEREGIAALKLDGLMIDYPVVARARRLLSRAAPLAATNGGGGS